MKDRDDNAGCGSVCGRYLLYQDQYKENMQRIQLKSKLHRGVITDGNVNYVGSITIPEELIQAADLWEGEKVLVVDHTNGARLETYVLRGKRNSGQIIMNGGSARLIHIGDRITVMAFGISEDAIKPKKVLLGEQNKIVKRSGLNSETS